MIKTQNLLCLNFLNILINFYHLYYENIEILRESNGLATKKKLCFENVVNHYTWRSLNYRRNNQNEMLLYQDIIKIFGSRYIVIHERSQDNCNREMDLINKELIKNENNLPFINLDYSWLKNNGINREHNLLDLRLVIEQAEQLHLYEGSIANFADSIFTKISSLLD